VNDLEALDTEKVADSGLNRQVQDIGLGALGSLLIALFLLGFASGFGYWQVAVLLAMALFVAGGLIGFLFGIPKVVTGTDDSRAGTSRGRALDVNTNLEQISDWLTKIIVGLGLIELRQLPDLLSRFTNFIRPGLHAAWAAPALATAVTIYFPVLGFISGYLITRLYLSSLMGRADVQLQKTAAKQAASAAHFLGEAARKRQEMPKTPQQMQEAKTATPDQALVVSALLSATTAQALAAFIQNYSPAYRQRLKSSTVLWVYMKPELVEDERRALAAIGIREATAQSAEQAAEIARRNRIDAIVCDSILDGKSSREFIEAVRAQGFAGHIVVYPSPGVDPKTTTDLLSSRLANTITIDPDSLFTTIVRVLLPNLKLS
jgi:hypothetical protein